MHQSSNNPYAFPLPACTAHTFQWEDGEHDTCYRCGAARPDKQEDRGALAKESTAALTTEPLEKGTIMDNSTENLPARGARVVHIGTNECGTVMALSEDHDELGELATVRWDNPDALELPRFLHTKHLMWSGDDIDADTRPQTVRELAKEARRRGMKCSELLREYTDAELCGEARRRGLPIPLPLTDAAGNPESPLPTTDAE